MAKPSAVLIGPPGAGKSTVGPLAAEILGVGFTDIDARIEDQAGKPVGDIFLDDGEEEFRRLERAAVAEALHNDTGIVALGGGAVLDSATQSDLAGHRVAYLQVDFAEAIKRVGLNQARPLLAGNPRARLKALLEERLPVYERLAAITVPTSSYHPKEVAEDLVRQLAEAP